MTLFNSNTKNQRYLVNQIHAKSLEGNPLNAPVKRDLTIYLPPNYFEAKNERYSTVYFLHGYSGNNRDLTVYPTLEGHPKLAPILSVPPIKQQLDVSRIPSYRDFDTLIEGGEIEPMIFVQPDGSLHQPNKFGLKTSSGDPITKGSFYVNSPYTGNYEDYILEIVNYIDSNYRTKADREHRLIAGVSMGGYGALSVGFRNLNYFKSIAALSPPDVIIEELLVLKLRTPIYEMIFRPEMAAKYLDAMLGDMLDSLDLVWSNENPLLSSIKRDDSGKPISFDTKAAENWNQGSLTTLLKQTYKKSPEFMKNVNVYLSCEKNDEFHLSQVAENIHHQLEKFGVQHSLDLSDDPKAKLSPHLFGCLYKIIPAIQHFLSI